MLAASTTSRVVAELRRRVLVGELLPGEPLRQATLADELGTSRVPLREAMLVLAAEGLLVHQPNRGFVVAKRSSDELAQIHPLLGMLESELLADDFVWPNHAVLTRLRTLTKRMSGLIDAAHWVDIVPLNREFHRLLWAQSPRNLVVEEVERLWTLASAYIITSYSTVARRRAAVEEHQAIIEALASRDMDQLRAAHAAHRDSTRDEADAWIKGFV